MRRIQLEINLDTGTTVQQVRTVTEQFENLQEQMAGLEGVSQQLGTNVNQTQQLLSGLGLSAEQASQAITGLLLEQQGIREAGSTISSLGLTANQGDVLSGVLGDPSNIQGYIDQLNALNSSLDSISDVADLVGGSIEEAEEFIEQLGISAEETARALRTVQAGQSVGADRGTQRQNLRNQGLNNSQADSVINRAGSGLQRTNRGVGSLLGNVAKLSFGFNQTLQAVQTFAAAGSEAFDQLILSNERLQKEILSTQASIAATTDVFVNGEKITDPSEAIDALEKPIQESIKRIRVDTLDLVGVTSSEVLGVFNILATSTGELADQSAEFPDGLRAAETLTKSFAAALGNLGIPLNQAKQEINSILQGQIDANSALAIRLNIGSEDVKQLKAQGRLVDGLNEKLEAFVIANAKQSRSIDGFTSNLKDLQEILFREAGEDIYEDVVDQLERLFNFVEANKEEIEKGVKSAVSFVRELLNTIVGGVDNIAQKLAPLAQSLGETLIEIAETGAVKLLSLVELLFEGVENLLEVLQPLLDLLGKILNLANDLGITGFLVEVGGLTAIIVGLQTALTALVAALPAIGTALTGTVIPSILATAASLAALLPLLLVVGTAIAALKLAELNVNNKELDAYGASVKAAGDETFKYAGKLRELNQLEAENGGLTAEQQKQKENLVAISKSQIAQNEREIETLKAKEFINASQRKSQQFLIQQLELSNKALKTQAGLLDDVGDSVKTETRALVDRGTAFEQIRKRIENTLATVAKGKGVTDEVSKQAQQGIKEIQQLAEAGAISTGEALIELKKIQDAFLNDAAKLAAQKAIFALLTKDVERYNETVKQAENSRLINLQQLLNKQLITEGQFNSTKAKLTTQRIKLELAAEKDRLDQLRLLNIPEEEKQEEIRKAQAKTGELQLQLLQQEKAEREALYASFTEDVEKFNQVIKQSQNERLIDYQELLNSQLVTQEEFNANREQLTTNRIANELIAEQAKLKAIQDLDIPEEEKQEETRQAIAKTTELQLQLLQQEKAERESIVALVRDRYDRLAAATRRETSEIVSGLEDQKDAYQDINRALDKQKTAKDVIVRNLQTEERLINSIAQVEEARRNLADTEGNIESDRLQKVIGLREQLKNVAADDVKGRRKIVKELQQLDGFNSRSTKDLESDLKQLEEDRFKRRVAAQLEEEKRARTLLEIELQRNEAAAARAVIEARIAENQARTAELTAGQEEFKSEESRQAAEGNLNVALESGDQEQIADAENALRLAEEDRDRKSEAVELSREAVSLAADSVAEAQKQVGVTDQLAANSRTVLDLQQQASEAQLKAEGRAKGIAVQLERGAKSAATMASALNSIQTGIGIVDGKLVTVEGRREGGAMTAGTPYVVGEGVGGKFLPGISEIIVPKTDSYAIASSKATEMFNQGTQNQITNNSYLSSTINERNSDLLNAVNGLRTDLKSLDTGSTTRVEGAQIINQFSDRDDKRIGMKVARDFLDELERGL